MYWFFLLSFLTPEFLYIYGDMTRNPKPMNSSGIDNFNLCRMLSMYKNSRDGYKAIFQDITGYRQLEKIIINLNEIPSKLIHFNKNLLLDFAKISDITDMELYIHGSQFYHSVEEMFKTLPAEVSYNVIDQHLQNLMISILTYEKRNVEFGYSASELRQCFKINEFAAQSVNIFGDLTINWFKAFSSGLTRYLNAQKLLQMTRTVLNSGPSKSCSHCMRDLSLGCPNLDKCFAADTKQVCSNPCNSYCINVFRGCLAPSILFFPKQFIYSNQKLAWSYSNPIRFDDLSYFLSATTVYHLIKKGIKEANENEALIQPKLEKFCRKNKPRTLQTTIGLFSNLNGNDHTLNETMSNYLQLNTEEYDKLNNFIEKVAKDLNSYLHDRDNKVQYMSNIELLYCSQEDKNRCWNGSSFDRYTRQVPEFTINGQLNNPEVKITSNDLKYNFSKEKNVIRKERTEENNAQKVNSKNDVPLTNPLLNQKKSDREGLFISESSGTHPSLLSSDINIPQMNPNVFESKPSKYFSETNNRAEIVNTDDLSDQIVVQGCFVDDEDCELNIADNSIDDNANERQYTVLSENESFDNSPESKKKLQDDPVHDNKTKESLKKTGILPEKALNSTASNSSTNSKVQENISLNNKMSLELVCFVCIFSIKLYSSTCL
ncbi:unnamed protein product [Schistosoma mattheei]|uniref:Uncharacterized protein n=1 Tax=Schistosoma mattheei TaxID=31246 RepID=A0AA85B272_9TREM|nr:unnamed protein product [Schistosoma mattheei]